jgi:transposase
MNKEEGPSLYCVHLTEEQRTELQRRTRDPKILPRTRDRLEMVRLSDAGFSIPRIARLLSFHEATVRCWIKRFLAEGFDGLPDQPHVGQTSQLTPVLLNALREELSRTARTWTAGQLADWLATHHGLRLTPDHLGFLLRRTGLSYKRTERSLKHKQDPAAVQQKREALQELEKGARPGAWTFAM